MTDSSVPAMPSNTPHGIVTRPDGLSYLTPQRARAFLGLVRAGDVLTRELNETLRRLHDLSLHAFEILLFLSVFADDGRMALSELTRQAPLSQSRVSRLVAELESRDLVERIDDPSDARSIDVLITESGVAAFRAAQDTHLRDLEQRLFSHLSEREIRQLAAITTKILDGRA